jgi:hypothetical protein
MANGLPAGDVLIVLPESISSKGKFIETATQLFETRGHRVLTLGVAEATGR